VAGRPDLQEAPVDLDPCSLHDLFTSVSQCSSVLSLMTPRRLLQIQYAASANSPLPRTTTSARRSTTGRPQDVVAVVSAVAVPRTVHACMVCVRRQQPGTRSSIFACVYVLIYTARRRSMVTNLRQGRSKKKKVQSQCKSSLG
jgi:hypothetical protein